MSGGYFDYKQHHINEIADGIERIVENNGRKKTQDELKEEYYHGDDWYERYPEDLYHHKYPDEVIEKFKEGLTIMKQAAIYTQRIDWLLSGNDSNDSFIERLQNDLSKLKGGGNGE
jgi:hypothetical protein